MNPYNPPSGSYVVAPGRTRWIRRFLILNGILLAFPVSIVTFIYVSQWIETALQTDSINGDPVIYQHEFVSASGPIWPTATFFLFSNLILFVVFVLSLTGQRSTVDA